MAEPPAGDAIEVPARLGTSEGTRWPRSAGQAPARAEPVAVNAWSGALGKELVGCPPRVRWGSRRRGRDGAGDLRVLAGPLRPARAAGPKREGDAEDARWVQRGHPGVWGPDLPPRQLCSLRPGLRGSSGSAPGLLPRRARGRMGRGLETGMRLRMRMGMRMGTARPARTHPVPLRAAPRRSRRPP